MKKRLRSIYASMHTRCENRNHYAYDNYGGRGITICEEWSGKEGFYNFVVWATSNGYDEMLTIDRIDNNKGYSPDNCRWVTSKEQGSNKRNNVKYNYHGEMLLSSDISEREGIKNSSLNYYLVVKKMSVYEAIDKVRSRQKI